MFGKLNKTSNVSLLTRTIGFWFSESVLVSLSRPPPISHRMREVTSSVRSGLPWLFKPLFYFCVIKSDVTVGLTAKTHDTIQSVRRKQTNSDSGRRRRRQTHVHTDIRITSGRRLKTGKLPPPARGDRPE